MGKRSQTGQGYEGPQKKKTKYLYSSLQEVMKEKCSERDEKNDDKELKNNFRVNFRTVF